MCNDTILHNNKTFLKHRSLFFLYAIDNLHHFTKVQNWAGSLLNDSRAKLSFIISFPEQNTENYYKLDLFKAVKTSQLTLTAINFNLN